MNSATAFEAGTDLTEVIAEQGVEAFATFAPQWLDLLDDALKADAASAIDVVPHNLIVTDDGTLRVIDVELTDAGVTRERVVRHGVFWLAVRPRRWPCRALAPGRNGRRRRCAPRQLRRSAGGRVVARAGGRRRGRFPRRRAPGPPVGRDADAWRAEIEKRVRGYANRRLVSLPFGTGCPTPPGRRVRI